MLFRRAPVPHAELVFDARRPDLAGMRQALDTAGCFAIRGLFNPEGLARIRARVIIAAQTWDHMLAHGYKVVGKEDYPFSAGHIPQDDIDIEATCVDLFPGSRYDEIATALFGAAPHDRWAVRRSHLAGKANPLPFHQDAFFAGLGGYNFWTPLNDCGVDSPGIEIIVGSASLPMIPYADLHGHDDEIAADMLARFGAAALWHPTLRTGDVAVFTTAIMHRSYYVPKMKRERYSLEIRGEIAGYPLAIGVR